MLKRCGLILGVLLYFKVAFCAQSSAWDLEPIVVTKQKPYFTNYFSVEAEETARPFFESLATLPVDLQSRSPKQGIQTDFSLRGSNFQQVLMLFNGQRINDPQTGHHNSDIPLTRADVERIDVIGGISSSLFGSDAIGGAINFLSKKPTQKKIILESSYGSFNTKNALFSLTERLKDWGFRVSSEFAKSAGFHEDTDFQKHTATFSSSLDMPDGEFNFDFGFQDKKFGAFDFYTPGLGYPSWEATKTYLLDTGLTLEKAGFLIKPNFLWRRHYDRFILDRTQVRSLYLNQHRTDMYTPNIYFQKESAILGKLGAGLEYTKEDIHSTNLGKHSRDRQSLFIDASKSLNPKLTLAASLRADYFTGFGQAQTGSFNFSYKIKEYEKLTFSVSRNIRVPSFTEFYYSDPTTVGNPDLKEEQSLNYQVNYDYKKEAISGGLTFFLRQEKDMIDWIKHNPAQPQWQAENITQDQVVGLESYFSLSIGKSLAWDSNYTYVNKQTKNGDFLYKYGLNYSKHLFNSALKFNLPCGIQSIGLTYKKKPGRQGWLLLNAYLSWQLNKYSQVFLDATNLLNTKYEEIEGIPQPGKWIEGGLRFNW